MTPHAPPIPNAAEMKRLLAARGRRPSRIRGQNFLIDPTVMNFIADAAELDSRDVVLEPGAGAGNLTTLLAARAGRVVAVEIDDALYQIASDRLADLPNVCLLNADILQRGARITPEARAAVQDALARLPRSRLKVVANLPYIVATAFITAVLLDGPVPVEMVVTVQKEVGDRLAAGPGGRDYGYLSVIVQAVSRVRLLRRVPPGAFWPPPEVDSAVVRITPDPALRSAVKDPLRLCTVAGALFQHRRKQLGRGLVMSGLVANRDLATRLLKVVSAGEKERAEELSVRQFVQLANRLSSSAPKRT